MSAASGLLVDLGLLFRPLETREQAGRLARIGARVVMLVAVVVAAAGVLSGDMTVLVEGTLVALLAFAVGWFHSRVAAVILSLLMALGIATGLAVGAAMPGLLLQVAVFGVCLRMAEAVFRRGR